MVNAHAHVQRLVSVVKMVTVLEGYTIEKQRCAVCFLWAKGLDAQNINKEMCPAYGGKCLSRKAVHNWVRKSRKAETTDKLLLCCGFYVKHW
jgi:hypothetical protein